MNVYNFATFWRNEAMDGEKVEVAETGKTWSTDGLMDRKPLHGIVSRGHTWHLSKRLSSPMGRLT